MPNVPQSLKLFKVQKLLTVGGFKGFPFLSTTVKIDAGTVTIDSVAKNGDIAIAEFLFAANTPVQGITLLESPEPAPKIGFPKNGTKVMWTVSKEIPTGIDTPVFSTTLDTEDAAGYNIKTSTNVDSSYDPLTDIRNFFFNDLKCKVVGSTDLFKCSTGTTSPVFSVGVHSGKNCTYVNSGSASITFTANSFYAFLPLADFSAYFDAAELFLYSWILIDVPQLNAGSDTATISMTD